MKEVIMRIFLSSLNLSYELLICSFVYQLLESKALGSLASTRFNIIQFSIILVIGVDMNFSLRQTYNFHHTLN